jgi:hypothetical protein
MAGFPESIAGSPESIGESPIGFGNTPIGLAEPAIGSGERPWLIGASPKVPAGIRQDLPETPIRSAVGPRGWSMRAELFVARAKTSTVRAKGSEVTGKGKREGARVSAPPRMIN